MSHPSRVHAMPSSNPGGPHTPAQHVCPSPHVDVRRHIVPSQSARMQPSGSGMHVVGSQTVYWHPSTRSQLPPSPSVQSSFDGAYMHPSPEHVSMVHATPSLQTTRSPATHVWPMHRSRPLQNAPSLQVASSLQSFPIVFPPSGGTPPSRSPGSSAGTH